MEGLLGSVLLGKSGNVATSTLTEAKYVLLYFSAHYCAPCRGFTPKLSMFYESVNFGERNVEVVFVSEDRAIEQFNEYYDEMPWLAIPYEAAEIRTALIQRYRGQGIPSLVLIDLQGNMKRNTCRMDVTNKGPLCLSDWDVALNTN